MKALHIFYRWSGMKPVISSRDGGREALEPAFSCLQRNPRESNKDVSLK